MRSLTFVDFKLTEVIVSCANHPTWRSAVDPESLEVASSSCERPFPWFSFSLYIYPQYFHSVFEPFLALFPVMSESATTPVTADFSSSPPKRTKIVLLGDQSVGKTSLITRYVSAYLSFCNLLFMRKLQIYVRYFWQHIPSHYWYRFLEQNNVLGR